LFTRLPFLQGRFDSDTFSEATVKVAQSLVPASVELWKKVQAKMLPTPAKFHYQFNMRDLSKVSTSILFRTGF